MHTRKSISIALLACLVVAIAWWSRRESREHHTAADEPQAVRLDAVGTPGPQKNPQATPQPEKSKSTDGKTLFGSARLSEAELRSYLEKHQRSAESLLVAYAATKDPSYLSEALENAPDEPMVLIACALHSSSESRQRSLDKLSSLFPDAAYPDLLQSRNLLAEGNVAAALEYLRTASSKPESGDFSAAFRELFTNAYTEAKGLRPIYAAGYANTYSTYNPREIITGIGRSLEEAIKADAGNAQNLEEKAALGLSLAHRLQETTDLSTYRQGLAMETEFLKYLIASGVSSWVDKPIGVYVEELEEDRKQAKTMLSAIVELSKTGGDAYEGYLKRSLDIGELAAIQEVKAKRQP